MTYSEPRHPEPPRGGVSKDAGRFSDVMRWNRRDPERNSLWLLPSGPDQVGEASARAGSEPYIVVRGPRCKRGKVSHYLPPRMGRVGPKGPGGAKAIAG